MRDARRSWDAPQNPTARHRSCKIDVVADAGYFRTEDIAACEKAGLAPHVPPPQRGSSASHGFFRKDKFCYDPERDAYACPADHALKPFRFGKLREMTKINYANKDACRDCPLRPRCTDAGYRAVSRLEHEDALDRMAARLELRPEYSRPPPRDCRTSLR